MENIGAFASDRRTGILLADHLELVRESLRHAILQNTEDMELIECSDFETAVELAGRKNEPQLAILALRLRGMNGFDGVNKFLDRFPDLPLAIISGFYQYTDIIKVFELGVVGFLSKEMSSDAIINAIRLILSGQRYVPEEVLEQISHERSELEISANANIFQSLTERELEVLELMIVGHSNKIIARNLGLEEVTIKMHIGKILRKLSAENRTHAVAIAVQARCRNCPNFPLKF